MTILFENNTDHRISKKINDIIEKALVETVDYEGLDYEFEVSVTMVKNDEIREINKEYRGIDKVTDVLSFPLLDFENPCDYEIIDEESDFNFDTGELMLGDIIFSYDKALEQSKKFNHSLEREIGFLLVHSMLHLLGYDHMEEEDEKIMNKRQKGILSKMDLKRE